MPRSSTPRLPKPSVREAFRRRLLAWWQTAARDLPWRHTRDPYRVLVSEFMLQQTQVSRVEDFYPRFLKRFPTIEHLARARPKAVREEWEGLGYYARARNLHALAKVVTRHHDATLPREPEELRKLPGIGPYTAGAVATFAYEQPVAAVDTNVNRVIRRAFIGSTDARRTTHETRNRAWEIATALVPRDGRRAWKFNQAVMELGALVCKAGKPRCYECPVRDYCKTGRRAGSRVGAEARSGTK